MRLPNAIYFPVRGIFKGTVTDKQPGNTSPSMNNVRPDDTADGRLRGGQRPGLVKWDETRVGDIEQPVVAICSVARVV
jgi:hypothetical protein